MRGGLEGFHQVNVAQPALVSAVFLSSYFFELWRWRPCLLRIYVAVLVRPLMYYNLPYSGRSGHIVAKHIAYSNYICHLKYSTYNHLSTHFKDPFEAVNLEARSIRGRPRAYNPRPVAYHPSTDVTIPPRHLHILPLIYVCLNPKIEID